MNAYEKKLIEVFEQHQDELDEFFTDKKPLAVILAEERVHLLDWQARSVNTPLAELVERFLRRLDDAENGSYLAVEKVLEWRKDSFIYASLDRLKAAKERALYQVPLQSLVQFMLNPPKEGYGCKLMLRDLMPVIEGHIKNAAKKLIFGLAMQAQVHKAFAA
ncbi:MAG: hypothetical protein PHV02_07205 [Rhodocyclaceae bacterium]|nr:hypothetical protein [Rhodocyclaceae bacterium]